MSDDYHLFSHELKHKQSAPTSTNRPEMKSHYEIVNDLEVGCLALEKYSELCSGIDCLNELHALLTASGAGEDWTDREWTDREKHLFGEIKEGLMPIIKKLVECRLFSACLYRYPPGDTHDGTPLESVDFTIDDVGDDSLDPVFDLLMAGTDGGMWLGHDEDCPDELLCDKLDNLLGQGEEVTAWEID